MYKKTNHHYDGGIRILFFPYGFFYCNWPTNVRKQVKESQSRDAPPLFAQAGVGA